MHYFTIYSISFITGMFQEKNMRARKSVIMRNVCLCGLKFIYENAQTSLRGVHSSHMSHCTLLLFRSALVMRNVTPREGAQTRFRIKSRNQIRNKNYDERLEEG